MPTASVAPTTLTLPAALPPLSALPKIASRENNKFTFNGLVMPPSVQSHSHVASTTATMATTTASTAADASETLRLKATVHTLNEKVAHLTSNLATTSESVMRGNKALVTERAQFHSQYASLQEKLKDTQATLAEAEAAPNMAIKNEKLLNTKIIELQEENARLTTGASEADAATLAIEERFDSLSAQHSVLLDKHANLTVEFEDQAVLLVSALADVNAAKARADTLHTEALSADALVDTLDSKLAEVRASTDPTGGCGCNAGVDDEPAEEAGKEKPEVGPAAEEDGEKPSNAVDTELDKSVVEEASYFEEASVGRGLMEEKQRVSQRCMNFQTAASAAALVADDEECCCEDTKRIAQDEHKYYDAMARRAEESIATGVPESVTTIHMFTDPNHDDATPTNTTSLAAHILPGVGFAKGVRRDAGMLNCTLHDDTGAEFPNTAEGRTQSFIDAVSRDLKLSMDGSQAAYQNSMKTGVAVRV